MIGWEKKSFEKNQTENKFKKGKDWRFGKNFFKSIIAKKIEI